MCASSGKAAAWWGYDAAKLTAAFGIPGPEKGPAGERGKYGNDGEEMILLFL